MILFHHLLFPFFVVEWGACGVPSILGFNPIIPSGPNPSPVFPLCGECISRFLFWQGFMFPGSVPSFFRIMGRNMRVVS